MSYVRFSVKVVIVTKQKKFKNFCIKVESELSFCKLNYFSPNLSFDGLLLIQGFSCTIAASQKLWPLLLDDFSEVAKLYSVFADCPNNRSRSARFLLTKNR